jgi:type IV pilus assembly protein PilA
MQQTTFRGEHAMRRQRFSAGFTLIEVMIVVSIIAILAAIAIPAYQDYIIRAQVSEGMILATSAKEAEWNFVSNTGRFPTSNPSAGLVTNVSISGNYVSKVDLAPAGQITVSFGGPHASPQIQASQLIISAVTKAGSIVWNCKGGTLASKYLPSSCR